ncbi:MAG: hypothetical protein K0B37_10725 [Bacteroidales bacterium]|nr:hypothetical protein [Bacteroidales bacterium]
MKKHKLIYQTVLLITVLQVINNTYGQCDFSALRNKILERVKSDLVNQDSSKVTNIQLTAGTDQRKLRGDKYCDTLELMLAPGRHFSFYLNALDVKDGDAKLQLFRMDQFKNTKPTLLKEIKSMGITVNSFDFSPSEGVEKYFLSLTLDKRSQGCCYSTMTQYMPKTSVLIK